MLESLFNKVIKKSYFIKKILEHRCFPVNIAKLLRTAFFTEHLGWLLLGITSLASIFLVLIVEKKKHLTE